MIRPLQLIALLLVLGGPALAGDPQPGPWSRGGDCLGGVCTGVQLDLDGWTLIATEEEQAIHRAKKAPAPLEELTASVDTRTGRVALVYGILKGREACLAAKGQLAGMVGEPFETSVDWWTWKKSGHSLRIHETVRIGDRVLFGACTLDRLDPRFDDREGTWSE